LELEAALIAKLREVPFSLLASKSLASEKDCERTVESDAASSEGIVCDLSGSSDPEAFHDDLEDVHSAEAQPKQAVGTADLCCEPSAAVMVSVCHLSDCVDCT